MNTIVNDRTRLPFWRVVVHLVRFDLRRFRLFAAVIAGLEIARAAFMEWTLHLAPTTIWGYFHPTFGTEEVAFFDFVLVVATGLATAIVVQADLPTDDRAFWRTRPIVPLALATAKLVAFALLFVALPAAINAGRLIAYGAPLSAMAAATLQILFDAGGVVAPAWALALATRTLPRFIAAVAVALVGGFLALGALTYWMARGAGVHLGSVGVGFDGGVDAHGLVVNVVFTVLAFAILVVHYHLRRWRVALAAGVVLVAITTLVPARRTAPVAPPDLARLVEGQLRLSGSLGVPPYWAQQAMASWPVYLTGRIEGPAMPPDVSAAATLDDARVVVDGRTIAGRGIRHCCLGSGPAGVVSPSGSVAAAPAAEVVVVGVPVPDVPAILDRRVAVEADADVAIARHRLAGVLPLRPGATFRTDGYLLEVLGLEPRRRALLVRFARFPRFGGGSEGLSLFVADPAGTLVITTTPTWKISPTDAASGSLEWAQGRTWSGRFQVLLTGIATAPADARVLIVETRPAGVARTTLRATDVPVRTLDTPPALRP